MASVKNLKKSINHTLGDIIGECYEWKLLNPKDDAKEADAIIDEAVAVFDALIVKVHDKKAENKKANFKSVSVILVSKAKLLSEKVAAL